MNTFRTSILSLLILVVVSGCQPANTPTELRGVGPGINAAYSNAENAKVVRWLLGEEGQKKSLNEAAIALKRAEVAFARERDARHAEREARIRVEKDLEEERNQFIGDRGWRYLIYIGLAWAGLGLLATYLSLATGGTSTVAGFLFGFLPFANIFKMLLLRKD